MARQIDLFGPDSRANGEARRDRGIATAEDHADAVAPGWSSEADASVVIFLRHIAPGDQFTTADVRKFAEDNGLPLPPDRRAWGGVTRRARRFGLIESVGVGQSSDPKQHRGYCTVWRRAG